jgi:hypothetical protein
MTVWHSRVRGLFSSTASAIQSSVTAAILTVPRPANRLSPRIVCSGGRSLLFHGVTGGGEIVGNDAAADPAMQALLPAAGEPVSPYA